MKGKKIGILIGVSAVVVAVGASVTVTQQNEYKLIRQFGKVDRGTVTEINDFLRLLYARASRAYSPVTGEEMVHYTDEQIAGLIMTGFTGRKIALMAPIVKGRKGHYRELFESLAKKGYIYARIDGEIREISAGMRLDRYKMENF